MHAVQASQLLDWLAQMLLIRRFEEAVINMHHQGHVIGHPHVYIGQEATAVGAAAVLERADTLYVTHRNHGHVLARGAEPKRLLAEIFGRVDGYNEGRGGTMHPVIPALGIHYTSAMVGGILPLAAGSALAAKHVGSGQVSVACFGDGSLEEGIFYETMNLAALWKLPVVFLCENNSLEALGTRAGETPSSTLATTRLTDLPAAFGLATAVVDGAHPVAVYEAVGEATRRARRGEGPTFVEARMVRWPGTRVLWPELVTGETDISMAWEPSRVPEQHRAWFTDHDPILRLARELLQVGAASPSVLREADQRVRTEMQEAIAFAVNSPFPPPESALERVFARSSLA